MSKEKVGSVEYNAVGNDYFEKRALKPYARVLHLWALGVGAVISGDFFGWNFGLASGGFGGLLVATVIITIMYFGLCYSIAEMSPAMPHAGGAYSFTRSSMGPWAGYITGLAENMEYILTPAVIVVGIGGYLSAIFNTPVALAPLWWLAVYIIFVALNIWGVEISFKFSIVITFIALAILAVFYIGAIPNFSTANWFNMKPDAGQSVFLPRGWIGIFYCFPFAIWFYLAIEELPLAAEESHDPEKDMPKGILFGLLTLIVAAFLTLFLNTGIAPGAEKLGKVDEPLFEGFKTIFGAGVGARILSLVAVAGLIASFHTIIYAYGRQIFSLSRAGYFPPVFSLTHSSRKTPHIALITGAVIGLAVALGIQYLPKTVPVGAMLLNMAVWGAVISYSMQMLGFIMLRLNHSHMERPYVSPLGIPGAAIALSLCIVTLVVLFINPDFRPGVYGAAVWFGLGLLYFAVHGRKQLVKSPEEEFALNEDTKEKAY